VFGSIGGPEMVVILIVALLIFGPRRLPDLARSLGKGISELRRTSMDMRRTLEREIHQEDQENQQTVSPPPAAGSAAAPPAGSIPRVGQNESWPAGRAGSPPLPGAGASATQVPQPAPSHEAAAPAGARPGGEERPGEDH